MSEDNKSLFSLAFPTLVGKEPGSHDDSTVVQTRGPWSMEESGGDFDESLDDSVEEFDLPEIPGTPPPAAMPGSQSSPPPLVTPDPIGATALAMKRGAPIPHPAAPPAAPPPAVNRRHPSGQHDPPPPKEWAQPPASQAQHNSSMRINSLEGPNKVIGGRYAIEARIGEGGMGRVYRVKHIELGKTFALKIMRSFLADDEGARKAFFREARLASSLSHSSIVSIVDFGEDPSFGAYMVMELLEGEPLKKTLSERGRFQLRQACDIMLQVSDAIRYIHEKGVVHCDIKAENVLLSTEKTETGRRKFSVKLLDFGLARPHLGQNQSVALSGTPAYIAPERIRGAAPSPSMDIYALGILFYELLTGAPPFTGHLDTVLYHHVNEQPVSPAKVLDGQLDERVEALIMKSLAKKPDDRQKNASAFMYELRTAMEMLGYTTRRRTRSKPAPRPVANDLVESLFAECPLPLAVFSGDGSILVGNKAFSIFIAGDAIDLRGVDLRETSMVKACPSILHDIRTTLAEGRMVQVSIQTKAAGGQFLNLMAWLSPAPGDADQVHCAIHIVNGWAG